MKSAAPVDQSRLIVSCRHVADIWLTDNRGKQDAKEDDEDEELHGHGLIVIRAANGSLYLRRELRLRHNGGSVKDRKGRKRASESGGNYLSTRVSSDSPDLFACLDGFIKMHNNAV